MEIKPSTKLTPKLFKDFFLPFAKKSEEKTGIDAFVILAQSALETGWNAYSPGWMMFGVKDWDGINGNEQLVPTFEFSQRFGLTPQQIGLHEITKVEPVMIKGKQFYKYSGTAWFRKYDSPEDSFTDHCHVFYSNPRFAPALAVKNDPEQFVKLMAPIYAQSPTYADQVISIMKTLKNV